MVQIGQPMGVGSVVVGMGIVFYAHSTILGRLAGEDIEAARRFLTAKRHDANEQGEPGRLPLSSFFESVGNLPVT